MFLQVSRLNRNVLISGLIHQYEFFRIIQHVISSCLYWFTVALTLTLPQRQAALFSLGQTAGEGKLV